MNLFILAQANGNDVQIISILLAAFGGIAINLLNLMELQKLEKGQRPDFRDPLYWLPFVVWPISGAVLAYAYETETDLNAILAINIGVSAPLIIRGFAAASPFRKSSIDPGAGA